MPKFERVEELPENDNWSDWVTPVMSGYKMACCDCGLVHDLEFMVFKAKDQGNGTFLVIPDKTGKRAAFRARRNNRSTGQMRRHRAKAQEGNGNV